MPFNDLSFVALVAAAAVLFHSAKGSVWRRSVPLGASGVFLGSFGDLQSLWPVVGFAAACVLAISLAAAWRFPALPLLAGLLALFVLLKGYTPVSLVPTWPLFTSAQEALVAFGSPGRFFRVFLLASTVGCLVRLVGSAVDPLGSKPRLRSTLARCATSPALVGIVAAVVVGVALIQSADLPAIIYYQRF